jgi:hypothetical protein
VGEQEGQWFVLRERAALARLGRGEAVSGWAGAVVGVRVRCASRGTLQFNAALCVPRSLASLPPATAAASPRLLPTRAACRASCIVVGRVTSDRAVSLALGCGAGTAFISLAAWLHWKAQLAAYVFTLLRFAYFFDNSAFSAGFGSKYDNQLLMRNVSSSEYRVVFVTLLEM